MKLEYLQCNFPKLTETNQCYILGLVEGLKQAQGKSNDTSVKILDTNGSKEAKSAFSSPH
ncbi:MAG: hypothetical protein FWD87_08105 [Spirochaetaceae bacterium]|nr:hypothetical protein [Spirochaetaceae bacterium]